eukprot:1160706-Pelagomonas_calceolata.AAC.6
MVAIAQQRGECKGVLATWTARSKTFALTKDKKPVEAAKHSLQSLTKEIRVGPKRLKSPSPFRLEEEKLKVQRASTAFVSRIPCHTCMHSMQHTDNRGAAQGAVSKAFSSPLLLQD